MFLDSSSFKAFRATGGERLMLHAQALEFSLPVSGDKIKLEAPYDDAFGAILKRLSLRRSKGQ